VPHTISGVLIASPLRADIADAFDLRPQLQYESLSFLPVDHYYTAYWAHRLGIAEQFPIADGVPLTFPREHVLIAMLRDSTGIEQPDFAIVMTEYFGGIGGQWALPFRAAQPQAYCSINAALAGLGVQRRDDCDEFDTVGLGAYRSNPDYLDKYVDLCDDLGL
jgi:hypothetical protein